MMDQVMGNRWLCYNEDCEVKSVRYQQQVTLRGDKVPPDWVELHEEFPDLFDGPIKYKMVPVSEAVDRARAAEQITLDEVDP